MKADGKSIFCRFSKGAIKRLPLFNRYARAPAPETILLMLHKDARLLNPHQS